MIEFTAYQQQKNFVKNTIRGNNSTVKTFTNWCELHSIEIKNVSYNEIMTFVEYCRTQGNSGRTIRLKVKSLEHYFNFLGLKENIATHVKLQGHTRQIPHQLLDEEELKEIYELQHLKGLVGKRDKVLLSLVIFQAVAGKELEKIEVKDVDLLDCKIYIPATRTANSRTLELKPQQLLLFQDYITNTRREILKETKRTSDKLLISIGQTERESMNNVIARMIQYLKKRNTKLKGMQQIRQSVITNWINQFGLRKAQYMAGHRFVSSTERYNEDKLDGLKSEIEKHFPI